MTPDRKYPLIVSLYAELKRFVEEEPPARAAPASVEVSEGRDRTRIQYGPVGIFWLDKPQARVVEELLDARMSSGNPDVDQGVLILASGARVHRLAEVFKGSPAWGRLVVVGARPGTYRLPDLPGPSDDDAA